MKNNIKIVFNLIIHSYLIHVFGGCHFQKTPCTLFGQEINQILLQLAHGDWGYPDLLDDNVFYWSSLIGPIVPIGVPEIKQQLGDDYAPLHSCYKTFELVSFKEKKNKKKDHESYREIILTPMYVNEAKTAACIQIVFGGDISLILLSYQNDQWIIQDVKGIAAI